MSLIIPFGYEWPRPPHYFESPRPYGTTTAAYQWGLARPATGSKGKGKCPKCGKPMSKGHKC